MGTLCSQCGNISFPVWEFCSKAHCCRRNFLAIVDKAKTACENAGMKVADHFADVSKTIAMPKGAEREVDNIMTESAERAGRCAVRSAETLGAVWQLISKAPTAIHIVNFILL